MAALVQQHREAVWLLAVAAAGPPYGLASIGRLACQHRNGLELSRIPKEAAVLDRDSIHESAEGGRLRVDEVEIGCDRPFCEHGALGAQPLQAGATERVRLQAGPNGATSCAPPL